MLQLQSYASRLEVASLLKRSLTRPSQLFRRLSPRLDSGGERLGMSNINMGLAESRVSDSLRISASYIKQAALRLRDDFDSEVPKTVDELCSLPGVGPKMAFLCLQSAWQM